jgi:ABC-type multidrug transport system permease subunit
MTNPQERVVTQGWEGRTPRSSDEFAEAWRKSKHRATLMAQIQGHAKEHPYEGERHQQFLEKQQLDKSKHQRERSPYLLSYWGQIKLTLWRCWIMLKNDPSVTITMLTINLMEALIVASVFYNLPNDSSSLYRRGLLLFYAVLLNAFACILEIFTLYSKRSIIEKHARYSFYHPSTEALSSFIMDLPYKVVNSALINLTIYFMGNLRRDPGRFFFYYLISFSMVICMSLMFRFIGSISKSISQALAPTSILLQGLVLYSGFSIPIQYMLDWISWFRWLNPIFYGLESVYINEFENRDFACTLFTPSGPGYESIGGNQRICNAVGSVSGEEVVSGQTYVELQYDLDFDNKWRNFGVLIAFSVLFLVMHLLASEYITSARSKGEVLLFKRAAMKKRQAKLTDDPESNGTSTIEKPEHTDADEAEAVRNIEKQTAVFHWKDVCYDIKIKGEPRRILDRVDGWVKPGTLTALMGVSGAGKTTLLDALASRITMVS